MVSIVTRRVCVAPTSLLGISLIMSEYELVNLVLAHSSGTSLQQKSSKIRFYLPNLLQ